MEEHGDQEWPTNETVDRLMACLKEEAVRMFPPLPTRAGGVGGVEEEQEAETKKLEEAAAAAAAATAAAAAAAATSAAAGGAEGGAGSAEGAEGAGGAGVVNILAVKKKPKAGKAGKAKAKYSSSFPASLHDLLGSVDEAVVAAHPRQFRSSGYFAVLMSFLPFSHHILKKTVEFLQCRREAAAARAALVAAEGDLQEYVSILSVCLVYFS